MAVAQWKKQEEEGQNRVEEWDKLILLFHSTYFTYLFGGDLSTEYSMIILVSYRTVTDVSYCPTLCTITSYS